MAYPIVTKFWEMIISRLIVTGTIVGFALIANVLLGSIWLTIIGAVIGLVLSCMVADNFREYQRLNR